MKKINIYWNKKKNKQKDVESIANFDDKMKTQNKFLILTQLMTYPKAREKKNQLFIKIFISIKNLLLLFDRYQQSSSLFFLDYNPF
jgi:hypothetical protein